MEENFQYHGIELYGSYLNYRSLIVAIFIINLIGIIFLISIIYIDELEELKENYEEYYNLSLVMVFSGLVAVVLLLVGMFLIIKYKNDISMEDKIINNILQITYAPSYRANLRNELATYLYNRIPDNDRTSHIIDGVNATRTDFKSKLADWLSGGGNSYDIGGQKVNRLGPVAQYGLVNTTGAPIPAQPPGPAATTKPLVQQQVNQPQAATTNPLVQQQQEQGQENELKQIYNEAKTALSQEKLSIFLQYYGQLKILCKKYSQEYPNLQIPCSRAINILKSDYQNLLQNRRRLKLAQTSGKEKQQETSNQQEVTNLDNLPPPPDWLIKPELSPGPPQQLQSQPPPQNQPPQQLQLQSQPPPQNQPPQQLQFPQNQPPQLQSPQNQPPQAQPPQQQLPPGQQHLLNNVQKMGDELINLKNMRLVTNKKNDLGNKLFPQKRIVPQPLTSQEAAILPDVEKLKKKKLKKSNRSSIKSTGPIDRTSPPEIISFFDGFYNSVMRMNMDDIATKSEYLKSQLKIYCNSMFGKYLTPKCKEINEKIQQSLNQPVLEDTSNYYDKAIGNNPPQSLEKSNQLLFTEDNLKSNPLVRQLLRNDYKDRCQGVNANTLPCKEMKQKMTKYKIKPL